ncbi:MAG: amidohydrolase family protein [candidate division KSB1 bacterium]|nr:amidohydrolase family protein [candidate division KSB1 bacterium]
MKKIIIINNAWICQIKQKLITPIFGDLVIDDGRIAAIRPRNFADFLADRAGAATGDIDAAGRVITVPLVNFHEHCYSRLAKGLPLAGSMANFDQILKNFWWQVDQALDLDMIRASAQMAVLESIQSGVTYIFDHHASPRAIQGSLRTIAEVFVDLGVRGVLCIEASDRHGQAAAQYMLAETEAFNKFFGNSELKVMVGLHATFTLSETTLQKAAQLVRNLQSGIHIHVCEDRLDRDQNLRAYNETPVQRLHRHGLLNSKSILAHGVHLDEGDYDLLKQSRSALAYNPDSNLNNSVGLPEYSKAPLEIPIVVGTDGMHANVGRSLKQILLLYRHQGNSFDRSIQWLQKIYFDQLAFVKAYFPDFPALLINDRADLIIWDYLPPTHFSSENFWGHFIYGMLEYPIYSVMMNGRVLLNNKNFNFDLSMRNQICQQGKRLYDNIKLMVDRPS